jgi:hypothetical protein
MQTRGHWRKCRTVINCADLDFQYFNLELPVKGRDGKTTWRRPNYAGVYRMIENPVYGAAYAYGRMGVTTGYGATGVSVKIRRRARSD